MISQRRARHYLRPEKLGMSVQSSQPAPDCTRIMWALHSILPDSRDWANEIMYLGWRSSVFVHLSAEAGSD